MSSRLPSWFRRPLPPGGTGGRVKQLLANYAVHTVCEGAQCPNRPECWHHATAAFMILGDACTRDCRFCAVPHDGSPPPPDPAEPTQLAAAAADMQLRHVVVTSVTRDDIPGRIFGKTLESHEEGAQQVAFGEGGQGVG